MVRFARDDQTVDVWIEKRSDGDALLTRQGDGEPTEIPTRWKFSAESDLRDWVLKYLAEGWRRVRDPEREADVEGEPRDPALDAALAADLDDPAVLVYADWYQQRHHPRGELITIQHALARQPSPELLAAERALLEQHKDVLLGPLDKPRESYHLGVDLQWQNGFIRRAHIHGADYSPKGEHLVWEVLRHPSARFLRELVIGCHRFGDQDNQLTTALLLRAGDLPPLRTLVLADFDDTALDNIDISRAWLGDLTGLWEAYPLLEDVILKGRGYGAQNNDVPHSGLRGLSLPKCRRFAFRTSGLMRETCNAILTAPWPELRELELWTGTDDYGCTTGLDDLAPLWRDAIPQLRVLRLMNCGFTDELCRPLADFVRKHPLDVIDFSLGTLSDYGALELVERRDAFAGLRELIVYDNCLTDEGLDAMRGAGLPVVETAPFPGKGWYQSDYDRTNGQKNDRYVSVSE
jgi:uncharacterized protein (TIGR02996 family)